MNKQNWTYKKIGNICDVKTGKLDANASDENGAYPFFTCSKEPLRINTYSYDAECVLIAGNGDLNVKYYNGKFDAYQRTYILTTKNGVSDVSTQYLYLFFQLYVETLRKNSIGGVIKYIKLGDITEANIPVPPLSTQSRIVSELDLLQSIIDKQKAQLTELDNLAQAVFYDMFGDPVENEKGWEVKKLGTFCSKIGSGATPRGGNESYKSEGISLIRSLNVHNNEFIYKDLAFIDEEQAQALSNVEIQPNDILLNITGASVARCCVVPNHLLPARVNQHVCIIRPSKDAEVCFLSRLLTTSQYQDFLIDLARAKAATREALPKNVVEGLPIILPPLSLQQTFAAKIESIEKQKAAISKSIAETEKLFEYTMDSYFG